VWRMVDIPLDRSRRWVRALHSSVAPIVRHGGWFDFFLLLAPAIGPRGYGLFALALSAVTIVAASLTKSASRILFSAPTLDDRHWSTALVTLIRRGVAGGPRSWWINGSACRRRCIR
jgi:hypothetical protein